MAGAGGGWRLDDWTIGAAPVPADDRARDPWTDVWDASVGDDLDEVWTPTFDSPDAAGPATHQPTAHDEVPDASPDRPPATRYERPPAPPERRSGHRDDRPPRPRERRIPAPDPRATQPAPHDASEEQVVLPNPDARDRAAPTAPAHDASEAPDAERVIDVTDAPLPPPLASLRSPRRPDQEDEALAALHSLQDQLQRLERGRGAPSDTGRRDARDVGRRR